MTRIERREDFMGVLEAHGSIDLQSTAGKALLSDIQVDPVDLAQIGNGDHIIQGRREFEQLYDRLVELDRVRPERQNGRTLDRAAALLDSLKKSDAAPTARPNADAGAVNRGPGILGTRRRDAAPVVPVAAAAQPRDAAAAPRDAAAAPPDAGSALPQPEPSEHLVATGRRQEVGQGRDAREVATNVVFTREVDDEVSRLSRLPAPAARRGEERLPSVQSYLDAADRYANRTGPNARRPPGVSQDQWALARALDLQNISAADVRYFLATGTLPDLVDSEGTRVASGEDRFRQLERAAGQQGSWTAVNSLTFLIGMRRSAVAAERGMLERNLEALPENAPERAELRTAIDQNKGMDRSLRSGLQSIYSAATYARERTSRGLVQQGDNLAQQAARARDRGDSGKADTLERRAQQLRDRGARMAYSEGQYRAAMPGSGFNAASTFRVAAQAQIARGQAEIADLDRSRPRDQALPEAPPPAVLGDGGEAATPNHVPGAGNLLTRARETDPTRGRTDADSLRDQHEQLALEGARQGSLANFHRIHLEHGGFFARPAPGQAGRPRDQAMLDHRQGYFQARVGQLSAADQRMELYGAKPPARDLVEAQRVEGQRAEILGELNGALGASLATDRAVQDQRARVDDARAGVRSAQDGLKHARETFGDSVESESDTRDRASALFGDAGKTHGEAERDRQSVRDARVITDQSRVQVEFAANGLKRAERGLTRAESDLSDLEGQEGRDRQDANLALQALRARRPGAPAVAIDRAYADSRAETTRVVDHRLDLVRRAESALRPRELNDGLRGEFGGVRVDAARWLTQTTELDARAIQNGRAGAEDRLTRAGTLLNEADGIRQQMAHGDDRVGLALGTLHARAGLAEAWSDYRPGESRDQINLARAAGVDVTFDRADEQRILAAGGDARDVQRARARLIEAYDLSSERIGVAAVNSLARSDARLTDIVKAGHHVPGARDELYRTGHELFDEGRPATAEGREAQSLLGRYDQALQAIPGMLEDTAEQTENGQAFGAAQTCAMGRAEIAMAQSQVSSLISGPVWLFTAGHVDMKEEMAEAGTDATNMRVAQGRGHTAQVAGGARDLADAWQVAVRTGRRFDFADSLRIMGDAELRSIRMTQPSSDVARTYVQAFRTLDGFVNQKGGRPQGDFQTFIISAVHGARPDATPDDREHGRTPPLMYNPVAHALTGPVLGLADARAALGDRRLAVMTAGQQDAMITPQIQSLNETKAGQWRAYVNLAGEVAVGFILTGGAGSAKAVQGAVQTANVVRIGMEGAQAARMAAMLINAGRTAGHALAVGAALMGASYGMRKAFGANSTAAHTFDVATNFIPFSVMQRVSGFGRAAGAVEANAGRLAEARRVLVGAGIAAGQAALTGLAVNEAAERGWVRSELGQMALGLGLNVLMAGSMGAYSARGSRNQAAGMAEGLLRHLGPEGGAPEASRAAVREAFDRFLSRIGGEVPTEAQMRELRGQLYDQLGAGDRAPATPERNARREAIDHFVEAVRVERAVAAANIEAGRGAEPRSRVQVERMVESAGDRLFEARGGEGKASRSQAYRDAALAIATGFEANARAVEGRSPSDAARLREAQVWARDRMIASDIANGLTARGPEGADPAVTNAQRAGVERVLASEIAGSEGAGARPLAERAGEPNLWTRVTERLQREAGLSPEAAGRAARAAERDLAERGLIPDPGTRITPETRRAIQSFVTNNGAPAARLVAELGEAGFMRAFGQDGHVSFRARELLDVPPAREAELIQMARERPGEVQRLLASLEGEHSPLIRRAIRDEGLERGIRLGDIAKESPQGLGYLSSRTGGDAEVLGLLRDAPDALAARARDIESRVFLRATDGTYLLRGPPPDPAPRPSRAELEGVARRAGVDPRVFDNPNANPREMARVMEQMRSELPPEAREALDREILGRRFVDNDHFEEARQAGVANPEERYGRCDFEAWQRAERIMMGAAREGRPLTIDLLREAHAAASEGILAADRRGRIRSAPSETVRQGGEGPLGLQQVTHDQLAILRANPDLNVADLGAGEDGRHRVMVEYLRPERVQERMQQVLDRIETRLRAGEDPVVVAADAQREMVSIHPFLDGNGRMSRLVMDYVLAREGLSPSVVRDPNLDTALTPSLWHEEVRDGLRRPFEATFDAWARARAGTPGEGEPTRGPGSGGRADRPGITGRARAQRRTTRAVEPSVNERPDPAPAGRRTLNPGTNSVEAPVQGRARAGERSPDAADLFTRRRTVGWSGEPTARPAAGQEHLGVIHRGREEMGSVRRAQIDWLLDRAAEPLPDLSLRRQELGDRQAAIYRDHVLLLSMPDQRLSPPQRQQKAALERQLRGIELELDAVDTEILQSRRQARELAVQEMAKLRTSLLGSEADAQALADRLQIDASAAGQKDPAQLRQWAVDFYRLVGANRGPAPEGLRLVRNGPRPTANRNGELNVGDRPTRAVMFHELGHYIEYRHPELGDAAKSWLAARSRFANGGREVRAPLNEITGGTRYRPNEHAFDDHFETPYIGKDYGKHSISEVLSVGLEYFTSPDRMLQLYQRDPEQFFFVLGALRR